MDASLADNQQLIDREIYFAIHRKFACEEANLTYEVVESEYEQISETLTFYEDWLELPNNAHLISVYLGPRGGVEIEGLYQTPSEPLTKSFTTSGGEESSIKICFIKKEVFGHKLTTKDKLFIKEHIDHIIQHKQFESDGAFLVPLTDWIYSVKNGI
jgi:hypothetical protein